LSQRTATGVLFVAAVVAFGQLHPDPTFKNQFTRFSQEKRVYNHAAFAINLLWRI
jgi:hypothetical protein